MVGLSLLREKAWLISLNSGGGRTLERSTAYAISVFFSDCISDLLGTDFGRKEQRRLYHRGCVTAQLNTSSQQAITYTGNLSNQVVRRISGVLELYI